MATPILDGIGSGFKAGVTSGNRLMVDSLSTVTTGSESFGFGKSGISWIAIRVDSNGVLDTNATFTGSIQIFDPKGIGSVLITNPSLVGSLANQTIVGTVSGIQATNPWIILGSTAITNSAEIGSISVQTVNGSLAIVEQTPTDSNKINFATQLLYSGTVVGSLISHNPAGGSFVQVLTYDSSDNLITVGSWV